MCLISLKQRELYRCISNSTSAEKTAVEAHMTDGSTNMEPVIDLGELDPVSTK